MQKLIFSKLSEQCGDRLMILTSDVGSSNDAQLNPIFLYHSRRTSGVAFYLAMKAGFETLFKWVGVDNPPFCQRIEDDPPPPDELRKRFVLICSHSAFGLHERFSENFLLSTIVREPVSRLGSTYMSGCMRKLIEPTTEGFERFLGNAENQNSTVRQLCGQPLALEIRSEHLDAAMGNLVEKFDSYVTTNQTNDLIHYYLSFCRLPNIVMDRPNRTLDRFKIDISHYRDQIHEQNSLDLELFKFVSENSRLPRHEPDTSRISPITAVVHEIKNSITASIANCCNMSTERFIATVEQHPDYLDDLNLFWAL